MFYNHIDIIDILNNKIHFDKTMLIDFCVEKTQTIVRVRLDGKNFWPSDVVIRFDHANTFITLYGGLDQCRNTLYTFAPSNAPALLKRIKNYVIFSKKH